MNMTNDYQALVYGAILLYSFSNAYIEYWVGLLQNVFFWILTLRVNGSSNVVEDKLMSSCNQNCNCHEEDYFPMCGRDGQLYFSPCYAGCTRMEEIGSDKVTKWRSNTDSQV